MRTLEAEIRWPPTWKDDVFDHFLKRFRPNRGDHAIPSTESGAALPEGAYRLHQQEDVQRFTDLAARAFPEFSGRITCFGADWLGTQFATDRARVLDGEQLVLMLEPGTGQVLEIPASLASFHGEQLRHNADAAIALSFYKNWISAGGVQPTYGQCVGYKVPLFLGGTDTIANLEISDLDVYWTLAAQLIEKVRGLPAGTPIGSVSIGS